MLFVHLTNRVGLMFVSKKPQKLKILRGYTNGGERLSSGPLAPNEPRLAFRHTFACSSKDSVINCDVPLDIRLAKAAT